MKFIEIIENSDESNTLFKLDVVKIDDVSIIFDNLLKLDDELSEQIVREDDGIAPSSSPGRQDRYQTGIKKRTRYQNGNDSSWQTPPARIKPKSSQ